MNAQHHNGFCRGDGSVMNDGFASHISEYCLIFLFEDFVLDQPWKYGIAVIGIVLMGIANQLLSSFRSRLNDRQWDTSRLMADRPWLQDALNASLFGVQMVLAYWLMLLVMLYDTLIFSAVIVGLTLGQFISLQSDRSRPINQRTPKPSLFSVTSNASLISVTSGTPCCNH